jgi:type IV pilus assembly protein PilB
MAIRRIGQILVDLGFITDDQLELLLEEQQQRPGELLGKIAEELGLITDEQLVQGLAEQMGLRVIVLADHVSPPEALDKVTETMAQMYRVVPVAFEGNTLTVATCDPQNLAIQDELRTFLGYDIRLVVATEREVVAALTKHYDSESESVESIIVDLENDEDLKKQAEALAAEGAIDLTSAEALADSAPVRKLLNMVLLLAIKDHASDVHFEPFEDEFRIRIKADGVLYEMVPPLGTWPSPLRLGSR